MKPTKEQIQWFWEQCGFRYDESIRGSTWVGGKWKLGDFENTELPPIDLNNLFKYAVPKLIRDGYHGVVESLEEWVNDLTGDYEKDTLSLFWVFYKALGG